MLWRAGRFNLNCWVSWKIWPTRVYRLFTAPSSPRTSKLPVRLFGKPSAAVLRRNQSYDPDTGLADIDVKNKFSVGDKLELILPDGNQDISGRADAGQIRIHDMHEASGSGYEVKIPLPEIPSANGLLARYTVQNQAQGER